MSQPHRCAAGLAPRRAHRLASFVLGLAAACSMATHAEPDDPTLLLRSEARLLEAVNHLEAGDLDGALRTVQALAHDVPSFRSAQLLKAQLLGVKAGQTDFSSPPLSDAAHERLPALQQEIQRRLQAHLHAPAPGEVPQPFLRLPASVRHAVAVDTGKSRLYLFANDGRGLRMVADFYVSVGQEGVDKRAEGDQRTPLGMYFITRSIPGAQLPDLYGVGALPINYPNDWDRAAGRTGSGIWLHGSPSNEFARLPLASDGCVVLSNPDMEILLQLLERRTPVLIAEDIAWVAQDDTEHAAAGEAFLSTLQQWQQAWRSGTDALIEPLYTDALLASPAVRQRRAAQARHLQADDFTMEEPAIYAWSDAQGELRIVNLHTHSHVYAQGLVLRQYWRREGGRWVLFSEDVLG